MKLITALLFAVIPLAAVFPVSAYTVCNGTLNGTVIGDVAATDGLTCELTANVTGSVHVAHGSTLLLADGALVGGAVMANTSSSVKSTGTVVISGGDGLTIENGVAADLEGHLSVIKMMFKNVSRVSLTGVNVTTDGVKVEMMTGDLTICDSRVGNVLEVKDVLGDFVSVEGPNCGPNTYVKDVKIELMEGNVRINGSSIASSELVVKEVDGNIMLERVEVLKAKIEKCGDVSFESVTSSDTEIKENDAVVINNSNFGKIGCFSNTPDVVGTGNEISTGAGQCTQDVLE